MNFIPPEVYTDMYARQQGPSRPPAQPQMNLYNRFEDPNVIQHERQPPPSQQQPSPPQQQPSPPYAPPPAAAYHPPTAVVDGGGQGYPNAGGYSGGYASTPGPAYGYAAAPGGATTAAYGAPGLPPGGAYGSQGPQPPAPPTQASPAPHAGSAPTHSGMANPSIIQVSHVRVSKVSERSKLLDHPSIPRITTIDVENDVARRTPGAPHIVTASRMCVRPTFHTFPSTKSLQTAVPLPIGINVRPFVQEKEQEVDFSELGNKMIRCRKCSGYINPFTTFTSDGMKWQCILCKNVNAIAREYYRAIDAATGQRADIGSRPELLYASADFLATPEFLRRAPHRPVLLLLLDCSHPAVASGLLRAMCQGALAALEKLKDNDALHMCVVGYDSTVYFFNVSPNNSAPSIVASPDTVEDIANINDNFLLETVELPLATNEMIVSVKESYEMLKQLLEMIPNDFQHTKEVGCAYGGAITACISILSGFGGKIISSICGMPSAGEGKLKKRFDVEKLSNKPKEYTMLGAGNDWYKQRALACSNCSVSIDIINGAPDDIDLATIAPLARLTSGSIVQATAQTMSGMADQMEHMLLRCCAFDCILRIRTSTGLSVPNFFGHCHVRQPDLLSLPVASTDSSYAVELQLSPEFKGSFAYVQFALVYTNLSRERRIRVHTMQIPVSENAHTVINSIDSLGMTTFLAKMCVDYATNMPFVDAQKTVTEKVITALRYSLQLAKQQGVNEGAGELLLPDSMRFMLQLLNGFYRIPATGLATSKPIKPDDRIASMATVMTSAPEPMVPYYVGWSYQLFSPHVSVAELPMPIFSTQTHFQSEGIYFVNLGFALILWYGSAANKMILHALGVLSEEEASGADEGQLLVSPEELAALRERVETLVWQHKCINTPVFTSALEPCKQGNRTYEPSMLRIMTEDEVHGIPSYGGFLLKIWQGVTAVAKK
ncbi:protein transport protein SEC24 [Strigomonas culicis]|uniref:Protein transport protein SEC24 n=1 Tax=Strigomonas culicis TaxID=28005 RepID=S9TW98_9TRYP|nr:protein transport protein SEC24 [Strigomonas culicis]|eukprot:EPY20864.1 protein transport protein SEC24 [Strigomonas culicis]